MHRLLRIPSAALLSLCLSAIPGLGFDSTLSDEAVREAYFLGQRHDASFLSNYIKLFPLPKNGPHISSVTFLTPFAQFAQFSSNYAGNYSAQQAILDHRDQKEFVKITVEIHLTATYGAMIPNPDSSRAKSLPFIHRPRDFWKEFRIQVFDGSRLLSPSDFDGRSLYRCGHFGGPCYPMGAALDLEFPPEAFTFGTATVQVDPPEGDPVTVNFDLTRLR